MNTSNKIRLLVPALLAIACFTTNAQVVTHELVPDEFSSDTRYRSYYSVQKGKERVEHPVMLSPTIRMFATGVHLVKKEGGNVDGLFLRWSGKDKGYGGLYRGRIAFKFSNGEILEVRLTDYKSKYIGGYANTKYSVTLLVNPYVDSKRESILKDERLLDMLKALDVEKVRIYFGEGHADFIPAEPSVFKEMMNTFDSIDEVKPGNE